nr:hypothetical protein CFP56_67020 [Quercus suber]
MPLCCRYLRFAALNPRHRHLRPRASSTPSPLFKLPWQAGRGTASRGYASQKNNDGHESEDIRGWYEYFDAILEESENSSPADNTASGPSKPATQSTGFERTRTQVSKPDVINRKQRYPRIPVAVHAKTDSRRQHAEPLYRVSSPLSSRQQRVPRAFATLSSHPGQLYSYGRKAFPLSQAIAKARFIKQQIKMRRASFWKDFHIPPVLVSIRSSQRPTAKFSLKWQTNFARLSKKYDKHLKDQYLKSSDAPVLNPATSLWVESILEQLDGSTGNIAPQVLENRKLEHSGQLSRWPQIALWLLAYDNERVVDFLLATHCEPYPPIVWVEDCLSLLAKQFTHANATVSSRHFQRLAHAFTILACRHAVQTAEEASPKFEQMCIRSSFIRLLLPHCSSEDVKEIYRAIKLFNVNVHCNTYHHISTWFAENGHLEQGIDALLSAQDAGSNVDSVKFRKNCSTLLRRTMQHPGGLRLSLRLVDNLVAMGVKLEGQLCTIIMLNALEAEDYNTAFLVYRSVTGQGLTLDDYDFSILLRACKANLDDVNTLTEVIQSVVESGFVRNNLVLATEILHCLALHHSQRNPTTVFLVVKDAYMEMFKAQPLQKLGLPLTSLPGTVFTPETHLHDPSPHAMNFMIATYLENTTDEAAVQLYTRWRELLGEGDEHAALLAYTPHTATIFLGRFTRKKETLLQAAQVIRDMQNPLPITTNLAPAPPDVVAWSVFLYGFSRHGQTKLARQVLNYMRKQGIEPTQFTLNNLVVGCAGAQDLSGIMDALREMSRLNRALDEWTYKGLSRYQNQAELQREMRTIRDDQQIDYTQELKEKLLRRVGDDAPDARDHPYLEMAKVHGSPDDGIDKVP